MKSGRRPAPPGTHQARGTYRPDRHADAGALPDAAGPPVQPEWLTDAGKAIWNDVIGAVIQTGLVDETDSTQFANYCNLGGALALAWQAGAVPPASALAELRRMGTQFGLAGEPSRLLPPQRGRHGPA